MESLIQVAPGDDDVVVAISGFGSASVGGDRWSDLAAITGRSVYYLKYDAQMLPWADDQGMIWPPAVYYEMKSRWTEARKGALVAARYLAPWLERWARAGRKILIVAFSLGSYVAWEALKLVPDELKGKIELVMMCGAIVDSAGNWKGAEHMGRIVNVFSYDDMALRYLYPMAVAEDETPAAGLGPLVISDLDNVVNVDLTDMVGRDHLWGSKNVHRLARAGLGCLWFSRPVGSTCSTPSLGDFSSVVSEPSAQRLYRWLVVDPELWSLLALGLDGDQVSVHRLNALDSWSLHEMRLSALLDAGASSVTLLGSTAGRHVAVRGLKTLSGMVRYWVERSGVFDETSS